jgi:hypothetical protein
VWKPFNFFFESNEKFLDFDWWICIILRAAKLVRLWPAGLACA